MPKQMDQIVSLCKRRGFMFQSSEIYGGLNGFWDYGPLGTELKRNVRDAWYRDMVTNHDDLSVPTGAPRAFQMVGLESSIIMHPQVWKCSGHYDLFHDYMVDCKKCKGRYRVDHLRFKSQLADSASGQFPILTWTYLPGSEECDWSKSAEGKIKGEAQALAEKLNASLQPDLIDQSFAEFKPVANFSDRPPRCPDRSCRGELTPPREFNLMFKTTIGALGGEEDTAFLRPETAQGMFVNFKNVCDSSRVKVPFGIAQVGKSFRNEITPRNFTFRSREFEQMEMEFFCHPSESRQWYQYWRDRRYNWYVNLGITSDSLQLRDHAADELSHYSVGTADIEYAFPFLSTGEFGELEGVAHRGDFDLRSHAEGKLVKKDNQLVVDTDANGNPKYRGSGKDLQYFDDQTRERFYPHVIEPAAGADRATLAFLCEAYHEDEQPDEKGELQKRVYLKFHPRLAPVKAAVFPLIKKEGMPEKAGEIYRELKAAGISATYSAQGAIGRRYRQQDEVGTPFCITVDGETISSGTVTIRDRDSLEQVRVPITEIVDDIARRIRK